MIKYLLVIPALKFFKCDMSNEAEKHFFDTRMCDPYISEIWGDEELNRKLGYADMTDYVEMKFKQDKLEEELDNMEESDPEFGSKLSEYFYYSDQTHHEEECLNLYQVGKIADRIFEIPQKEKEGIECYLKQPELDF